MSPEKGFVSYVDSDYPLRYHWVFTNYLSMGNAFMNRFLQVCLVCFAVACGSSDKGLQPEDIPVLSEGDILLTDAAQRALFRIHPSTGDRTVVTSSIGGVPRQIARDCQWRSADDSLWKRSAHCPAVRCSNGRSFYCIFRR